PRAVRRRPGGPAHPTGTGRAARGQPWWPYASGAATTTASPPAARRVPRGQRRQVTTCTGAGS
ncbi:hypothetical protein, partial [Streptomyces sp. CC77]|uniref:hypothetical protein n=1 Tax=Streptomyces sp. CC77 TaxID=1906739 RepID=UPI001C31C6AA